MGKIKDIAKKIIKGGPETQRRKAARRQAQQAAREQEEAGYAAGLREGAYTRGRERGVQAGRGGSGASGFLAGAGRSMKAFNEGANAMGFNSMGIDFGSIGQGGGFGGGDFSGLASGPSNLMNMGHGRGARATPSRVVHHVHHYPKRRSGHRRRGRR